VCNKAVKSRAFDFYSPKYRCYTEFTIFFESYSLAAQVVVQLDMVLRCIANNERIDMSVSERWLLPDGVDELLPPEAWSVELMRRSMLDVFSSYGYELVSPPLIEYLESLLTGTGNDLDLQTFKVTDQLTGRMMGVRADITPQVARIDTHLMQSTGISRLCYVDTVLHTRPAHKLTNRCPLQIGCELFGEASQAADIEIISLMLEALSIADIERVHIDLAHVGIYNGLIESASLDLAIQNRLFDALSRKSIPELDVIAEQSQHSTEIILLIRDIANLSGGVEALDKIRDSVERLNVKFSSAIVGAIEELQAIIALIQQRFPMVNIGVDFCELRGYNYHTGILFSAYSLDYGHALAKGGRYDGVGKGFDRQSESATRPATGFSADLKAISRVSKIKCEDKNGSAIFAPASTDSALLAKVSQLRASKRVIQGLDENDGPSNFACEFQLECKDGEWDVYPV
jgi:ATP phosphoribosyltransferase regulatory subunit